MSCRNQWRRLGARQYDFKCSECGAELYTADDRGRPQLLRGLPDTPARLPAWEPDFCPICGRAVTKGD